MRFKDDREFLQEGDVVYPLGIGNLYADEELGVPLGIAEYGFRNRDGTVVACYGFIGELPGDPGKYFRQYYRDANDTEAAAAWGRVKAKLFIQEMEHAAKMPCRARKKVN